MTQSKATLDEPGRQPPSLEDGATGHPATASIPARNEEFIRSIIDSSPDCIKIVDKEGRLAFISSGGLAQFGLSSPDEIIGVDFLTLWDDSRHRTRVAQALDKGRQGIPSQLEGDLFMPTGEHKHWLVSITPMAEEQLLVVSRDITTVKRAQEELARHEALLNETGRMAGIGGWELDLATNELYWSREVHHIHEVAHGFMPDVNSAIDFYAPEHRALIRAAVQKGIQTGDPWDLELKLITARGRHIWVRAMGKGVLEDGRVVKLMGSFQDITSRVRTDQALRESERKHRMLFEEASEGVLLTSTSGRIQDANPRAQMLFGYSLLELNNIHFLDLADPDDLKRKPVTLDKALSGDTLRFERRFIRRDDTRFHAEVSVRMIGYSLLQVVFRDITEQKRMEKALVRAKELAEEASQAKSEFLARISHEIRTPLHAVISMSDLALDASDPEEMRDYVATVKQSGTHLLSIINRILDFSRIEAGRLELQQISFPLAGLLESLRDTFSPLTRDRDLELGISLSTDLPDFVQGDPVRLKQVLGNLLDNAIKFTPAGSVVLEAARDTDTGSHADPDTALVRFTVRDTGIGIAPDKLPHIFTPFVQIENALNRQYSGTGLGLTICRELVDRMGGLLELESTPGEGSRFQFTIPLRRGTAIASAGARDPFRPGNSHRLHVLLVEDNENSIRAGSSFLFKLGHEFQVARNGLEALTMLREASTGRPYDLVLMDIEMPLLSGLEATRRIRAGECGPHATDIPIVALTAHALPAHRDRFLAEGMDHFLAKPFSMEDLAETLANALQGQRPGSGGKQPPSLKAPVSPDREGLPVWDKKHALLRFDNDLVLFEQVTRDFFQDILERLDSMEELAEAGDLTDLTRMAHSVKGNCATLGAERCAWAASRVEDTAQKGLVDECPSLLRALRAEVEGLLSLAPEHLTSRSGDLP